ncbi:MAG: ankyrin repeat domain-containing protein [Pseudomonadota bacterium]|nr:ankyrin repeat domain-containing protein [Pseudomonadota bacterium]
MKALIAMTLLLTTACIVQNNTGQAKFIIGAAGGGTLHQLKILMPLIFKPQWKVGYRYGAECSAADKQNGKALQAAMSDALRAWLAPLKELQPAQPLVDEFVYELQVDVDPHQPKGLEGMLGVDLRVTFECMKNFSEAWIGLLFQPNIFIRQETTKVTPSMLFTLLHEFGHAFGLSDTYARDGVMRSRGGLQATAGIQPASIMAALRGEDPATISEDDKRGIIWLYKYFHEKQAIDDCFFADYVYVQLGHIGTCTPKHPLIFEVKHNHPTHALQILKDDPNLNVNAQDVSGMTALHYAVMYEKTDVVKALLAHKDIKPFIRNKEGETALDIAKAINNNAIVRLFPELPLGVTPTGNPFTTWGAIKKE